MSEREIPYLLGTQARMLKSEISVAGAAATVEQYHVSLLAASLTMNVNNQLMPWGNIQVHLSLYRIELFASFSVLVPALVKKANSLWKAMFQSSSSYLILAILQILQFSCRADAGSELNRKVY